MAVFSVFQVLGPIMIGPSSSHTAGAVRIGWLARQIVGEQPVRVKLGFRKSLMRTYSGHATALGLIAGLLGYREDDTRVRTAKKLASEAGMTVEIAELSGEGHPNEMRCDLTLAGGRKRSVSGVSIGGGSVLVSDIDGIKTQLDGLTGGLLVTHFEPALPAEMCCLAYELGLWVDDAKTSASPTQSAYCTFIPGPDKIEEDVCRLMFERWRPSGISDARWIDAVLPFKNRPHDRLALFSSIQEMDAFCRETNCCIPEAVIRYETRLSGLSEQEVVEKMASVYSAMRNAVAEGLAGGKKMLGGYVASDNGRRVWKRVSSGLWASGSLVGKAVGMALAVSELNACMGRIVAAPTAGSCGVIPGVLCGLQDELALGDEGAISGLLAAAGIGAIMGQTVSFSGSIGGCQSEIGVAAAMASAMAAYLLGGNLHQMANASAIALKSLMGLVCDPVAGPVEIPCIKRNGTGAALALTSAELALAGVMSGVPPDEIFLAMKNVEGLMHEDLRDNTLGGLGSTPTATKIKADWAARCACSRCFS